MSSTFSVFSRFGRAVRASFVRRLDLTVAMVAFLYGFFLLRESLDRSVPDGLAYYLFDNGYVVLKYVFWFFLSLAVVRLGLATEPHGASSGVPFVRLFGESPASLRSHWKTSLRFTRYVFLYLAIAFSSFFVLTKIVGFAFPKIYIPMEAAYLFVKVCWSLASVFLVYRLIRAIFVMPNAVAL